MNWGDKLRWHKIDSVPLKQYIALAMAEEDWGDLLKEVE